MTKKVRFRVRQGGITVAGADSEQAAMNYAEGYREYGPVTVQHNAEGHWKLYAMLCQWPVPAAKGERA